MYERSSQFLKITNEKSTIPKSEARLKSQYVFLYSNKCGGKHLQLVVGHFRIICLTHQPKQRSLSYVATIVSKNESYRTNSEEDEKAETFSNAKRKKDAMDE